MSLLFPNVNIQMNVFNIVCFNMRDSKNLVVLIYIFMDEKYKYLGMNVAYEYFSTITTFFNVSVIYN